MDELGPSLDTVSYGARCNLAYQQQIVVGSIMGLFADEVRAHLERRAPAGRPYSSPRSSTSSTAGRSSTTARRIKQPDWTHHELDSGQSPADRLDEHRAPEAERELE